MEAFLDLSPIEQELEALSAIYLDELIVHRRENDQRVDKIELVLHPATGDDTAKQFVRMNLVFQPGCQYPDEVPGIEVRNPRGLGEEEIGSLVEDMREKAQESVGEVMLYTLIEMAKEALTEGNIPHCPCVVCLEHFQEHDHFHRTACYHYFHNYCLHKYLEHSRQQLELDKIEAERHRHLNPEDEKEKLVIVCPVCRTPMDDASLTVYCSKVEEVVEDNFVIPPNIREQQKKMAELYEIQKAKGAIIDVEWERNKFLVNADERVPVTATDNISVENSSKSDKNTEESKNGSLQEGAAGKSDSDKNTEESKNGSLQEGAAGKSDSSSDYMPKRQQQRISGDRYDSRRQVNYYSGRKDGRTDRGDRRDTYRGIRHGEYINRRMDGGDRRAKIHGDGGGSLRDCPSSDERSVYSGVSEEGGITFVNSKSRHSGHNDGAARRTEGAVGRGRGRRSDEDRREPFGRQGKGERGGGHSRMEASSKEDNFEGSSHRGREGSSGRGQERRDRGGGSGRGRGGFGRRADEESFDLAANNSQSFNNYRHDSGQQRRGRGGRIARGTGDFGRKEDEEKFGVAANCSQSFGSNRPGSKSESGQLRGGRRGRGGFSRGMDRDDGNSAVVSDLRSVNNERVDNSNRSSGRRGRGGGSARERGDSRGGANGDENCDAGADNARSFNSPRNNRDHRNDSHYDKKGYDDHNDDGEQQRRSEHTGYNQQRNPRGGGRRNGFDGRNRNDRRGQGYNDSGRGRDGRDSGGNRSDQHSVGRFAGGHGRNDGEDDEEEGKRKESDMRNLEINQRWRELNFQGQSDGRLPDNCQRKRAGFRVIDDDEVYNGHHDWHGNNSNDFYDEDDDDIRHNANYDNDNLYAIASSDSEEDWGKESDPFTFERRNIHKDQFEEYSKYKAEHLASYAQRLEKRVEKQNMTKAEQRRIQREHQLKKERELRAQVEEREEQASRTTPSLSVLEQFKLNEKKKQMEETAERESFQRFNDTGGNDKLEQRGGRAEASNPSYDAYSNKEASGDVEYHRKKSGPLPNKNKVEGIKWVGVRDHDDVGEDLNVDDDGVSHLHSGNAFEDSWKRREEKERQRRKQPGMKAKKKDNKEKRELDKKDEMLSESSSKEETRVRSRRRDKAAESLGWHRNFDKNIQNDIICSTQGDTNVHKQSVVGSAGITKVSSREENVPSVSSDMDSVTTNDNLQRKDKKKKPLDLRKKTNHGVKSEIQSQFKVPGHINVTNLVETFPSLHENDDTDSAKLSQVKSLEGNGFINISKNYDQIKGEKNDDSASTNLFNILPAKVDKNSTLPNAKTKPKPLDFRKNAKKAI